MLKPPEFMAQLSHAGEGVQVFANALLLAPGAIAIGEGSRIDDFCRLEGGEGIELGRLVHVCSFASIFGGGRCLVGDQVSLAQGSRVITGSDSKDASMSTVAPAQWRNVRRTTIVIDHLAFLATNAVMLPGTSLGVGAIAGAGAVVTKPVPAWEIWAGNPAVKIGERDPEPLRARGVPVDELSAAALLAREG